MSLILLFRKAGFVGRLACSPATPITPLADSAKGGKAVIGRFAISVGPQNRQTGSTGSRANHQVVFDKAVRCS